MTQPAHPPGRTTAATRHAIQQSEESIRILARRYGLNPKTVAKWRRRSDLADRKAGPAHPRSTVLTPLDEALILIFRRHVHLPLDDSLAALRDAIPHLSRSSLHRCLKRHDFVHPAAQAPSVPDRPGCFLIDITALPVGGQPLYLFTAVERRSQFIFARLCDTAGQTDARDFLTALAEASPCTVALVMTDDRLPFTTPGNLRSHVAETRQAIVEGRLMRAHPFEYACAVNDVDHHLIPPDFPWTEPQAERAAQAIGAALSASGRPSLAILRAQLDGFLAHYNDSCALKPLGGLTPRAHLLRAMESGSPDCTMDIRDMSPMRTRGRDSTREAILEAARSRLAKDGPEGLSLSEVARIAGVNRGTAYQHFKTRENLIAATAQWVSEKLYRAVFDDGRTFGERPVGEIDVAELIDRLANFAMDNPELCRAWLLQVLSSPDPASDLFWREYQGSTALFAQTELAQDNVDSEVLSVIMLAGAFLWPVWARTQQARHGTDLRTAAHRFAQECLRISMNGNMRSEFYPQIAARLKAQK